MEKNSAYYTMKYDLPKTLAKMLPIFGMISTLAYLGKTLRDPLLFKVTADRTKDTEKREKSRGLLVSLISAVFLNLIGMFMVNNGVPEGLIILNFGFILGPVIGYMCDIGIGTESGLKNTLEGNGLKYVFGSLATPMFFRYIVTVFLDMFISNPIQDAIKLNLTPLRNRIQSNNSNRYGKLIKNNFSSILQSIVGILTFQAYTNETRFRWAYSPRDNKNRISNDTIVIATALSASLFCVYNMAGAESPSRRLTFAIIAILTLSAGSMTTFTNKETNESVNLFDAEKKDMNVDDTTRASVGAVMFAFFLFIGLIYPLYVGRSMKLKLK
jgi:hypothetical protein